MFTSTSTFINLSKKTVVELSQYNLNDMLMESMTLKPEMKLLSQTPCEVASKQDTNLASIVEVVVNVYFMLLQDMVPL